MNDTVCANAALGNANDNNNGKTAAPGNNIHAEFLFMVRLPEEFLEVHGKSS